MSELHVWVAEVDFVIAESAEEACRIFLSESIDHGCRDGDGGKPEDWTIYPDDKFFVFDRHGDGDTERKQAREFIAEFGKGYFASSEY